MIKVIVHFREDKRQEIYSILTYLRGDQYWQFLCLDGTLKIIPDSSVDMIEIINEKAPKEEKEEE